MTSARKLFLRRDSVRDFLLQPSQKNRSNNTGIKNPSHNLLLPAEHAGFVSARGAKERNAKPAIFMPWSPSKARIIFRLLLWFHRSVYASVGSSSNVHIHSTVLKQYWQKQWTQSRSNGQSIHQLALAANSHLLAEKKHLSVCRDDWCPVRALLDFEVIKI